MRRRYPRSVPAILLMYKLYVVVIIVCVLNFGMYLCFFYDAKIEFFGYIQPHNSNQLEIRDNVVEKVTGDTRATLRFSAN